MNPIRLKDLDQKELQNFVAKLGEKQFHGRQIFAALFRRCIRSVSDMTDLSLALRDKLTSFEPFDLLCPVNTQTTKDRTTKVLFEAQDGNKIESVWIPEAKHSTQCLSTQAGCPLDCTFCATGKMGWKRNLTAGEILDQVVHIIRLDKDPPLRNIVFMGMGEPLLNYENLVKAIRVLSHPNGFALSQRRMTVSTAGIIPGINQLSDEGLHVKLAISLNAPTDQLRNQLMPINNKYPIGDLIQAAQIFQKKNGFRITFEYALMPGINDTKQMILALRDWLVQVPSKLNLIPLNPIDESQHNNYDIDGVYNRFYDVFHEDNIVLTLRRSRGSEIQAACGQLAGRTIE